MFIQVCSFFHSLCILRVNQYIITNSRELATRCPERPRPRSHATYVFPQNFRTFLRIIIIIIYIWHTHTLARTTVVYFRTCINCFFVRHFFLFSVFFFVLLTTQKKAHKIYNACPEAFYLMMPFLRCQHGRKNSRLIFNARLNATTNKTPTTTTAATRWTNWNSKKAILIFHLTFQQYFL